MSKYIMFQGTGSHVGKSILVTALCRIFYRKGYRVAPFKAQNMALNSYVTQDGLEMGRAQVAQAEAAGLEPEVDMNPVLLKPTGDSKSQVIINGKPVGNLSAREYHKGYSLKAFDNVKSALGRLSAEYDTIVIEGAGSPAEVNLRDHDIVNMRVAKYLNAPVLLIADIDRGGALASLVGTLELLAPDERALVKGLIVNKFRGDVSLFQPAVEFLEKKTGKPVLGILPYIDHLGIDDEDSVSLQEKLAEKSDENADVRICVIRLPKLSNFTDFDSLEEEPDVGLDYVNSKDELDNYDAIIIPGSKNTTGDMKWLEQTGMAYKIKECATKGIPVIGICGGYQILGERIEDPHHIESDNGAVNGLGLLPMNTVFGKEKHTVQVECSCNLEFLGRKIIAEGIKGYEIHVGDAIFKENSGHPIHIERTSGKCSDRWDGLISGKKNVFGTYIHGIFDSDTFRRGILNAIRGCKGLEPISVSYNRAAQKQECYERLADIVEENLDMDKLDAIMKGIL